MRSPGTPNQLTTRILYELPKLTFGFGGWRRGGAECTIERRQLTAKQFLAEYRRKKRPTQFYFEQAWRRPPGPQINTPAWPLLSSPSPLFSSPPLLFPGALCVLV